MATNPKDLLERARLVKSGGGVASQQLGMAGGARPSSEVVPVPPPTSRQSPPGPGRDGAHMRRPAFLSPERRGSAATGEDPPWPDERVPAGSNYGYEEWEDARRKEADRIGRPVYLVEVRNAAQSTLIALPAPYPTSGQHRVVEGKPSRAAVIDPREDGNHFDPFVGELLDGCLLLAPSATTSHPREPSRPCSFATGEEALGKMKYRVVRPRVQRRADHPLALLVDASFDLHPPEQNEDEDRTERPRA